MLCASANSSGATCGHGTGETLFRVSDYLQLLKWIYLFRAAAMASGCKVKITPLGATCDLRQNKALGMSNPARI